MAKNPYHDDDNYYDDDYDLDLNNIALDEADIELLDQDNYRPELGNSSEGGYY